MTSRTVSGGVRGATPAPTRGSARAARVSRAGRPGAPSRRTGPARTPPRRARSSTRSSTASRESSDSMSMWMCAPSSCGVAQQRAQALGRVAAAPLGSVGSQQRGQRRDLHRHVRARDRPDAVALEHVPDRPVRLDARQLGQRLVAPGGVAVRLGLGHGGLAEQVDRAGHAAVPQVAQHAEGRRRRLADDEPVGHVPHSGGRGGAERGPAGLDVGHPHRGGQRRRCVGNLAQVLAQVAGEVVERAAGRRDVDEPEQGGAQLPVPRGQVHGPLIDAPGAGGARSRETPRPGRCRPRGSSARGRPRRPPRAVSRRPAHALTLTRGC